MMSCVEFISFGGRGFGSRFASALDGLWMFEPKKPEISRPFRAAIGGLMLLSGAALVITIWVMIDFLREQVIVSQLIRQLPPQATASAVELAGELKWQFRLSTLVFLNLIVTAVAVMLLWRAYRTSQQSLYDIKVLAGDILNSMDQGVMTTDQSGIITSINRRGSELLGWTERMVGKSLQVACQAIDLEGYRREVLAPNWAQRIRDFILPRPDGHRTLRVSCEPLYDGNGKDLGAIIQLRDVTERALVQQQVLRMKHLSSLGSLAAGLHHEIKNPLTALSLHVQLFEEQQPEESMSPATRETLEVLKTEVARVLGVLESFRSYTTQEFLDRSWVAIPRLLEHQLRLLRPQASAAGIELELNVRGEIPDVYADRAKIEQVFLNLLLNAIEAMPSGGSLKISIASNEDRISIALADQGVGIAEEFQERIFDPYFTTKGKGTGMGLALSEKIIRQHGGALALVSSQVGGENSGSVFEILLPVEQP